VAAGGSGDGPVTEASSTPPDRSRIPLNIALWLAVMLAAVAAIFLGKVMYDQHDRAQAPVVDVGSDVGSGVVQAMDESPRSEQERIEQVLEQGTKFVDAFLNVDYRKIDAQIATVHSMGTAEFQKQYDKGAAGLKKFATQLQSITTSEVVWAAYESGDADSATVLLATQGTGQNKMAKTPALQLNRVRLDLTKVDGRWLANNVVMVGATS
jgi:hypothetical protein